MFTENRVDEQLAKALDRKVYLPSGGSLVIDRTEAMVVIDVNTGKFIGKGGNLEETVTKNNLEAAEEIARQLRLRDLGGIIVIDFIDMILESNREQVLRRLVECLGRDRTKHQVAEVTSLGLVQMTRKRVGQGLIEAFSTTCESCGGRGIHVHMEPVNKKSLDREITPTFESKDEESDEDSSDDESDSSQENSQTGSEEPSSDKGEKDGKARFGRRRRRASSSGVVTA
jgi:Rne/Rng family ribonuclease